MTRGLTIVLPIVATLWIVRYLFVTIDAWFQPSEATKLAFPGLGLLTIVVIASIVGIAAKSNPTRKPIQQLERGIARIPVIRLVHGTIKDVFDALLGRKKRFDKPVLVHLGGGIDAEMIGFVTSEDLGPIGREGSVVVYFPQSYNIAGSLIVMARERLQPIDLDATTVMSFVMSGGVSELREHVGRPREREAHVSQVPVARRA